MIMEHMYIQDTGSQVQENGTHVHTEYWITGTGKWNTCTMYIQNTGSQVQENGTLINEPGTRLQVPDKWIDTGYMKVQYIDTGYLNVDTGY